MKRQLVVIRHTKSSWKEPGARDFDRPLKKDRLDDARKVGKYLHGLKLTPDAVICSPAMRTRQTAELMCEKLQFSFEQVTFDKRIYESSAAEIMQVVRETEATVQNLVVIGHNPSLTHFVNLLVPNSVNELPTTGVAWLELESTDWEIYTTTPASLRYFISPKAI